MQFNYTWDGYVETYDLLMKYSALLFFASASFGYLAGLPVADENRRIRVFAHVCFSIGLLTLLYTCFRDYDGRVWADSSGLLLALFVGSCGLFTMFKLRIDSSGAFFAPFCTLILLLQHYFTQDNSYPESSHSLQNILAGFHVLMAVLGEALIIVGFALAAAYLRRRRQLRSKDLREIHNSKFSLEQLASLFNQIIWGAFVFISLSLISGALFTQLFMPEYSTNLILKVIWGFSVWLTTLAMILLQKHFRWPFRRIAYLSGASLLLLALAFFGLTFNRIGGGL